MLTSRRINVVLRRGSHLGVRRARARARAQEGTGGPDAPKKDENPFAGLSLRGIGPALMSGRVSDIAVDPVRPSTWYIVAASGGVWKTVNAGTTWTPIFDSYGSYSIGCVTIDPNNHLVVWVGTGENNSQRSVGYGDGLYKSIDGGASFTKVGLENSEHIARVLVDPRALERRLRRRAGAALEGRRRPRAVQDDRRRQDLEGRPLHQREHGGDRRRLRPAQSRRALRRGLPAPAPRLDPDRRRTRVGHLPLDRRRGDLAEDQQGTARRRQGPHRPGDLSRQSRRRLRHRRGRQGARRLLPLRERRRELGEAIGVSRDQPAVLPARSSPTRRCSTGFMRWTRSSRSPRTAASRSTRWARSGSTSTITPSGSIPAIRTT